MQQALNLAAPALSGGSHVSFTPAGADGANLVPLSIAEYLLKMSDIFRKLAIKPKYDAFRIIFEKTV